MFERWLSPLLASLIGHYVKGLQAEQLRLGLWHGVLRLENVELRLEARPRPPAAPPVDDTARIGQLLIFGAPPLRRWTTCSCPSR